MATIAAITDTLEMPRRMFLFGCVRGSDIGRRGELRSAAGRDEQVLGFRAAKRLKYVTFQESARRYLFQIRVWYDFKPLIFGSRLRDPENWSATLKAPWTAQSDFFSRAETTVPQTGGHLLPSLVGTRLPARRPGCEVRRSASPYNFPPTPLNPISISSTPIATNPDPKADPGKMTFFSARR